MAQWLCKRQSYLSHELRTMAYWSVLRTEVMHGAHWRMHASNIPMKRNGPRPRRDVSTFRDGLESRDQDVETETTSLANSKQHNNVNYKTTVIKGLTLAVPTVCVKCQDRAGLSTGQYFVSDDPTRPVDPTPGHSSKLQVIL